MAPHTPLSPFYLVTVIRSTSAPWVDTRRIVMSIAIAGTMIRLLA
jgi:hypothetical protein